jgi:hypothetical protein
VFLSLSSTPEKPFNRFNKPKRSASGKNHESREESEPKVRHKVMDARLSRIFELVQLQRPLLQLGTWHVSVVFLSVKDAASQLGLQPVTVRAHVARGNLKAQKLAGALWIDLDELQRFGRERRSPGARGSRKTARWEVRLPSAPLENSPQEAAVGARMDGALENRERVDACLAEASDCAPERKSF